MREAAGTDAVGPSLPGMRCIRLIGSGGFADVYQYERDRPKGQQVAVKLLKNFGINEPKYRQFDAEADAMAALEHPYIVPVLWTDTAPDGRPYIVMRYYPSQDLAVRVSQRPMNVEDALKLGIQLAGAVETAHRAKIIHRDIKPSNILVSPEGWPALSDFGIAGGPDTAEASEDVAVSVAWSPPEVLTGQSDGSVVADVYSLAATIWNLLTGRAPFEIPGSPNEARDMFPRIVHSKPPSTGRDDVPASLDRVLQNALSKDPALRPQTAFELARHFQRVEQELRLIRTEIIVHDPPTASGQRASVAPPSSDNRTQLRGAGGVATLGRPMHAGKTIQKPATPIASAQQLSTAPATELRPQQVDEAQGPAEDSQQRRTSHRLLLLGSGAGIVVVAIPLIVGVSLSQGGGPKPVASTAGTKAADNDNANVLPAPAVAAPDPQPIAFTIRGHSVVFTWAPVRGAARYEWALDPGGAPTQVTATQAVVPEMASGPTCILVHSVTPGAPDTPGTRTCAK